MPIFIDSSKLKKEGLKGMGQRLRNAREQAVFSVPDMSCILNISERVYRNIEEGNLFLSCEMMATCKQILGISLDWLFTGEEPEPEDIVMYHELYFGES